MWEQWVCNPLESETEGTSAAGKACSCQKYCGSYALFPCLSKRNKYLKYYFGLSWLQQISAAILLPGTHLCIESALYMCILMLLKQSQDGDVNKESANFLPYFLRLVLM